MFKTLCIFFVIISTAYTWPRGAPSEACGTMMPQHGSNIPQPAHKSPYSFVQSTDSYKPGDQVIGIPPYFFH